MIFSGRGYTLSALNNWVLSNRKKRDFKVVRNATRLAPQKLFTVLIEFKYTAYFVMQQHSSHAKQKQLKYSANL